MQLRSYNLQKGAILIKNLNIPEMWDQHATWCEPTDIPSRDTRCRRSVSPLSYSFPSWTPKYLRQCSIFTYPSLYDTKRTVYHPVK